MALNSTLSRIVLGLVVVFGWGTFMTKAQVAPPRTTTFELPPLPEGPALGRRDLAWIKTGNDFNQSGFTTAEAIDKEIEKRVSSYDRETAIVTFDVPFNSRRLIKPINKRTYNDFDNTIAAVNANLSNLDAYFWKYGDIDIAVSGDTYQDQLNVYAVIRALEILRYRYPKAYQKLFVETRKYTSQAPTPGMFVNRFKTVLITFHTSTTAEIAEGGQALGANEDLSGPHGKYSNLAIVSIHATKILGAATTGSNILYRKTPNENYTRYLREGLVETLVHEMLHRYIDTRTNVDALETSIFKARPLAGGTALPLNNKWEEAFIINTSLSYFIREGGLQPSVPYHYRSIIDGNIAELEGLRLKGVVTDMSRLTNFTVSTPNHLDIMRLTVLD
ncbi:MAG: hypothetical protein H7Z16_19590 [Pyrinomonadaceae bacterium]|nr:hypothetical protein [Pyrinomonadaceae bacterium]